MGALPYIAVGRRFYAFGYLSNSNLLVPIGASLVLVAFIGAARLLVPGDRRGVLANCIIAYIVLSCASIWSTIPGGASRISRLPDGSGVMVT